MASEREQFRLNYQPIVALDNLTLKGFESLIRWHHPDRGAIAINDGALGESYATPVYLDQGWDEADSLWFYNTTQGSGLLPYDFPLRHRS